ncbi:MAG: oxidoreductase [Lachnospiraceae bacterium]|nr:oxidoreductase [Lachnospiraceae bacterium]
MIYKKFKELELSALGLGAMRLPVVDGDDSKIDMEATRKMVAYAMENGINYFDTAWAYHGGQSELVMGELLAEYDRESFYLASKFPGFDEYNMKNPGEIFEKQLEKCRVDYFDFYLFHCIYEANIDWYLDEKYGTFDYILEQKKKGRIKHLGFSTHGSLDTMKRFLDAYGKEIEFCQIQLNYFDWKFQDAKAKVELLKEYNIPVWVMEPVRGGKLASLDKESETMLKELRADETIPAWAFRFIQGIDSVVVTLSGMSNQEQLSENIITFEEDKRLNDKEEEVLMDIVDKMIEEAAIPCTSCRYCTAKCPQGLDIPELFSLYNKHRLEKDDTGVIDSKVLAAYDEDKKPSACIGCRNCEKMCPQGIKISEVMKKFTKMLGE